MKKVSAILLSFMMVLVLLAGCTGGSKDKQESSSTPAATSNEGTNAETNVYPENGLSKDEKVTIKVGFWESGAGRAWMDLAVKNFTAKYPNVSFDITATPTLETILEPKIASGDDKEMFDLFFPKFSAGGQFERLVEAGKFEPQDDLWERDLPGETGKKLRSVISDDAYEGAKASGYTARVPVGGYTAGLFFDQNLFDQKGWNKNPGTWDEFVALLDQIKADGVIPITFPGVYAGYLTDYVFNLIQFDLAKSNGSFDTYLDNFRNYEGAQYTTEENKEAWNRLYEFGKKGYFPAGVAALNHTQSQMQVLQHKAALVSTGDWVGNEMKESTPADFKWGFMALPATNDADQTIFVNSGVADVGFVIWKEKPDLTKKWAKEFILSLYDFSIQEALATDAGTYPGRLDYGDDPARIGKLQPTQAAVMEYATKHKIQYLSFRRNFGLTSAESGQAGKLVSEMITGVATGKKDPVPVLEQAEKLIQKAIEKDRPKQ
ncbi:ABC transporter substrate-binding protein [Paenibacillus eucommiae]|uniref:N-acetylglucosamine transport system substrate-binding protein n=1 Tax=Paenibacillus eucommiae TaxID=1355755 RepID=A0ABS4J495_9BACL|nr:ABC transporter substrate-binding protein [Paenibacillus eucommiae]MBP1993911.1 N-acetylglucosamine transport system substrate-binding protein [Paenibacillus eucommiae]